MLTAAWFLSCCKELGISNKVYVAYSGGRDSHVLLHLAVTAGFSVTAVHINDHINDQSDLWQAHCNVICNQLQIPCLSIDLQIKRKPAQSLEEAARIARRDAWREHLESDSILLLGHHAQDQAETILYRLIRGTGPKGLSGMRAKSKLATINLLRPLLTVLPQDIDDYAIQHNLQFITDEMNFNLQFDRNYIRHKVMPHIIQRWSSCLQNIQSAGKLIETQNDIIESTATDSLTNMLDEQNCLILQSWKKLLQPLANQVLIEWLKIHNVRCTSKLLEHLIKQVIYAAHDKQPVLVIDKIKIRRYNNKLIIAANGYKKIAPVNIIWDLQPISIGGIKLSSDDLSLTEKEKEWLANKNIIIKIGEHGRRAKKVYQKYKIPAWERYKYPAVYVDGKLFKIAFL